MLNQACKLLIKQHTFSKCLSGMKCVLSFVLSLQDAGALLCDTIVSREDCCCELDLCK